MNIDQDPESAEHLEKRVNKERLTVNRRREDDLSRSLGGFRVGNSPYLNTAPLTRGLEQEIIFAPPSQLAAMLKRDELDAALVSVTEALLTDRYDVLDGLAVASLGEVRSVFLAHKGPLTEAREIYCDTASLTSVNMLRVLLAEQGLKPDFKPLASYELASMPDYALLIGDRALDFSFAPHPHEIWDLGTAWFELTGLPFVHAVWLLRRGVENKMLRHQLREARDFGLETLDYLISTRQQYTLEFRKDYLSWHIHYHLGTDEKRGLARFGELMKKHGLGPVYEPNFVS